jgi:PhzF family phenazine biosynthesis protein
MAMKLTLYQADAFTEKLFSGNPAAVIPLPAWLPDETMQKIAMENNLSETAFFVPDNGVFNLRWFTPSVEVDLCGHATLASAHILFNHLKVDQPEIRFQTRSGLLTVKRNGEWLTLNFPSDPPSNVEMPPAMEAVLGVKPVETLKGKIKYLAVLPSQDQVVTCSPDFSLMKKLDAQGVIVTAQAHEVDFVSRFFAPNAGIDEDPVTGSAHCVLVPYWSRVLGKTEFTARQVSARGGFLKCRLLGDRVEMSGQAATYLTGEIDLAG